MVGMRRCVRRRASLVVLVLVLASATPVLALDDADRLWMVGERSHADGLHLLARRVLERLIDRYPRDARVPDAVFLLGRSRLALGDLDGALEAFRRAQTYQPPMPWRLEARFWEGEALFRLKRYAEARGAYDAVLRTDAASPLAPDAAYGIAFIELETRRPERAVDAFGEFLKVWPDHALAPSVSFYLARALVEIRRYDEALPYLVRFAEKYPSHKLASDARFLLGWTRVTAGDARGGIAELRAFVAANPSHPQRAEAQRLILATLARSDDPEELTEAYRGLTAQRPSTPESLSDAASVAGRLGRRADQEAALRRLRAEFPRHALARRAALDLGLIAFAKKDWKEAASLAQAATGIDDEAVRAEAFLLAGESELKLRRYASALKAFDAVAAIQSAEPDVRFRALAGLGVAHEEQKEWRPALAAYETVADASPDETLREWARDRAAAIQARLKPPAPAAPVEAPEPKPPAEKSPAAKPPVEKPKSKPSAKAPGR
jgi:TolA-binding protein